MSSYDFRKLKWGTGAGLSVIQRSNCMAEMIRKGTINGTLSETSYTLDAAHAPFPISMFPDEFRYPVIINMVGVGTSGKNTFSEVLADVASNKLLGIHKIEDISVVDGIYAVVEQLIDETYNAANAVYHLSGLPEGINRGYVIGDQKGDAYRQFMHDVKDAWSNYFDGPVLTAMCKIVGFANTSKQYANVDLNCTTTAVFVQNRDKDTIETMKRACNECGLINFTVLITGRETPEWTNDCDAKVKEINADIVIDNSGTIEELTQKATTFAAMLHVANSIYGVRLSSARRGAEWAKWYDSFDPQVIQELYPDGVEH